MLSCHHLSMNYGSKQVLDNLHLNISKGEIVSLVGSNGCGKSTLFKILGRYLFPIQGRVELEGKDIFRMKSKEVAKKIGLLPQVRREFMDISVETLVSYGRYPYLGFSQRLTKEDKGFIQWALDATDLYQKKDQLLSTLSGGERQRAWLAMALAQQTEILLLDEPTTFLDISYQLDFLDLIYKMNQERGLTVFMILHDINQAIQYSHRLLAMKEGTIYIDSDTKKIPMEKLLQDVFGISGTTFYHGDTQKPYWIPKNKI